MWPGMNPQGDDPGSDLDKIRQKNRDRKPTDHPEMSRSTSGLFVDEVKEGWRWILKVKGLGVVIIVTKTSPLDKYPQATKMSTFTEDEIKGHA